MDQLALQAQRLRMRAQYDAMNLTQTPEAFLAQGWARVWPALFGPKFEADMLAPHHLEAINWHWEARASLLAGEYPQHDAYMALWSRGHIKTTIARRIAILDAAMSGPGYCLYVGGTMEKIRGHALSIETLLTSPAVKRWFPKLGQVRKSESTGQSKGWTQLFIYTDHGYVFHFVSLEQGVAGANVDNLRPSMLVPDDIDDRHDSPKLAQKKLDIFLREILPTKQENTLVFHAQNVINRRTITYRIATQKVPALARRFPTKPIPAINCLKTERQTINGIVRDMIVAGEPTWPQAYGLERAQQDIDTYTLEAFEAECQHNVEQQKSGLILPEWDERVHVISWSQFEQFFGTRSIPSRWQKVVMHDWGNTHPCVVSCLATASATSRMPGAIFLFAGLTFPQNTRYEDVALDVIERLAVEPDGTPIVDTSALRRPGGNIVTWNYGRVTSILDTPHEIARTEIRGQVDRWLQDDQSWVMWHMSHEQKTIRDGYRIFYGLPFVACNPGASGGVGEIGRRLKVDYSVDHPFKPGQKGRAGMYLVVDDDQLDVARDDRGLKLWRDQFPEWQWVDLGLTDSGLKPEKPMKVHDDAGNTLMMYFVHLGADIAPVSMEERIEAKLPPGLRMEAIEQKTPEQRDMSMFWREMKLSRARKQENEQTRSWSHEVVDPDDRIDWGGGGDSDGWS